ncbi:RHS repeat-associated core domain-containing protein [Streptomyces sp. LN245]|uniref:RHS repeat-associated core domain-containing protein n=1 Tax=Streptomyces sp. LN245 TaxID=3112975 RepID=UPI00370FFFA1
MGQAGQTLASTGCTACASLPPDLILKPSVRRTSTSPMPSARSSPCRHRRQQGRLLHLQPPRRGVRTLAQSTEPVAQPYRFAGNYQDPTGLYHLQARYYDANIGRFIQPDASGQEQKPLPLRRRRPCQPHRPQRACILGLVGTCR